MQVGRPARLALVTLLAFVRVDGNGDFDAGTDMVIFLSGNADDVTAFQAYPALTGHPSRPDVLDIAPDIDALIINLLTSLC